MIKIRHLTYYVAVVEAGSLSRAAQLIHLAQPSLSQQISELEREVGAVLLQRSSRGVRPTPAGEVMYREALAIVRRVQEIPALIRQSADEIAGTVTLGMSTTLASVFSTAVIDECARTLPQVRLALRNSESTQVAGLIAERAIDVGVVYEDAPLPKVARRELYRQRLFIIGGDAQTVATAAREGIGAVEVVLPTPHNVTRAAIDRAAQARGQSVRSSIEIASYADLLGAVRTGRRVALLPKGDLDEGMWGIARPLAVEPPVWLTASLVSSEEYPLSRAAASVAAVVERVVVSRVGAGAIRGAELPARLSTAPAAASSPRP